MASLDSKTKRANILGTVVGGANKLVNEGFIGNTINNYGMVRDIGGGIWNAAKKHNILNLGDKLSGIEQSAKSSFHALPDPVKSGLKKFDKGMSFAFNKVQLPIGMADLGLSLTGLGGSKEIDEARKAIANQKQLKKLFSGPKRVGYLSEMNKGASLFIDKNHSLRDSNISIIDLRDANIFEIPDLIKICKQLRDKFLLDTPQDEAMLIDRMYSQNTLLNGETPNPRCFVNYGMRSMNNFEPKIKYIRIVYTSPEHRGEGLAKRIIETITSPDEPVWMQICSTNSPMIKMASKIGFNHIDTWHYNGHDSQIWARNINQTKTASKNIYSIGSPME